MAAVAWARPPRHASGWAAGIYTRARDRGCKHAHAVRILARAWIYVIWHCWQDGTAYNPDQHRALQRLIQSRNDTAA